MLLKRDSCPITGDPEVLSRHAWEVSFQVTCPCRLARRVEVAQDRNYEAKLNFSCDFMALASLCYVCCGTAPDVRHAEDATMQAEITMTTIGAPRLR